MSIQKKIKIDYKEYSDKLLDLSNKYDFDGNHMLANYYISRIIEAMTLVKNGENVNFFYDSVRDIYLHEVQYFD